MLRFLIQSKRLTAVGASLRSFKRCSLLMFILGTWKDRKSHIYKKRTHTQCIRLLLTVVAPISRVCTHEYFFMTCSAYARTRHKWLTLVCASLSLLQTVFPLLMLTLGTWKDRKPHIYKKRTHTWCIRLLLTVVAPISRTGTHASVAATYPFYVSDPT